jgi:hypothetical protein
MPDRKYPVAPPAAASDVQGRPSAAEPMDGRERPVLFRRQDTRNGMVFHPNPPRTVNVEAKRGGEKKSGPRSPYCGPYLLGNGSGERSSRCGGDRPGVTYPGGTILPLNWDNTTFPDGTNSHSNGDTCVCHPTKNKKGADGPVLVFQHKMV